MTIQISDDEFRRLAEIIHSELGISYKLHKKYLIESRLKCRLERYGYNSFSKYIEHLTKNPGKQAEIDELINAVTTNETSFFRNIPQLDSFIDFVMPKILENNRKIGKKKIRIWSAACSTGEEIYTLGILLNEKRMVPPDTAVEFFASDVNDEVLEQARTGVFQKYALRNTPENIKKKYFRETQKGFGLKTDLLPKVRFEKMNLQKTPYIPWLSDFDVVFCRNVLIYFSDEAKTKVAKSIYKTLLTPGYLYIGHSESLYHVSKDFRLTNANGMPVYLKDK